jgi:hypothetical protein
MKILFIILTIFVEKNCISQRTFFVNKSHFDSLRFEQYKIFIASKNEDINFIGKKILDSRRFTPEINEAYEANSVIETQYATARQNQLEKQYDLSNYADTADWQKAMKVYKEQKQKIIITFEKEQNQKIYKFDRYFWGYLNDYNERLILIRFDPHKIKYYTISGERFEDTLSIMVYNIVRKSLSLSGWADFKE